MEITNEIKAKVFAQYFGQRVFKVTGDAPATQLNVTDFLRNVEYGRWNGAVLTLKPLSEITNEDAVEVAKILGVPLVHPGSKTPASNHFLMWKGVEFLLNKSANEAYKNNSIYFAYQYLQSKGYDLPHYLLGGKTLHEAGLAVYK